MTQRTVNSKDGTPIAYFEGGSGPPLLLVHGTTADHARWAPLLPALEQSYTVYAMDRRGRGASGDAPSYEIEREFADVASVVDAIAERVQDSVFLLAHSYGAVCSLEAALLTHNVRKLILYEPPIPTQERFYPIELLTRLDAMLAEGRRDDVVATFFRDVARLPPAELDLLRSQANWPARVAAAHTITREMNLTQTYRFDPKKYAAYRTPTLLLLGGDSHSLFKAAIDAVAAAISSSRVVVLPGQRHTAMNTAPELFLRAVVDFLSE